MKELFNRLKMEYIYWWARRLPACDELLPLMSQRMDGTLPFRKRLTLLLHNHICDWCRRYAQQLLLIRQAMKEREAHLKNHPISDESLSSAARDRLKRALNNQ